MPKANDTMRTRILEAAIREFSNRGFEGTTTRHIAARAKCGEPSVYRIFKNKSTLFLSAVESALTTELPYFPTTDVPPETTSVLFMTRLAEMWQQRPERFRLFVVAALSQDKRVHALLKKSVLALYGTTLPIALARQKKGELRGDIHPIVATMILTAAAGYHHFLFEILGLTELEGYTLETTQFIASVSKIWLKGVRPD